MPPTTRSARCRHRSAPPSEFAARSHPQRQAAGADDHRRAAVADTGHGARRAARSGRPAVIADARRPGHHQRRLCRSQSLLNGSDTLAKCFVHTLIPTGNEFIQDPPLTTGLQVYQELFQSAVGLAGASAELRRQRPIRALDRGRRVRPGCHRLAGRRRAAVRQRGAAAARHTAGVPGQAAAHQRQRRLLQERAAEPELGQDRGGTVKRAIREPSPGLRRHRGAGRSPRSASPCTSWSTSRRSCSGRATTRSRRSSPSAAAVTSGQGQAVTIAGVQVGQIGGVSLQDGNAVVTMNIYKQYAPIYRNATVLLRPRTPLKDMYLSLDPGTKSAGALPAGATLGVGSTQPDVDVSEILSSLDADTRNYLVLLLSGGAQTVPRPGRQQRGAQPAGGRRPAGHAEAIRAAGPGHGDVRQPAGDPPAQHPPRDPQPQPGGQLARRRRRPAGLADQRVGHELRGDLRQRHPAGVRRCRCSRARLRQTDPDAGQGPGASPAPAPRTLPELQPFARNLGPALQRGAPAVQGHDAGDRQPAAAVLGRRAAAGADAGARRRPS